MLNSQMKHILRLAIVTGATFATVPLANAQDQTARQIPYQTPNELRSTCISAGGDYYPPGGNGAYGCQLSTGATIFCGGVGDYARTCSNSAPRTYTERTDPNRPGVVIRDHRGHAQKRRR